MAKENTHNYSLIIVEDDVDIRQRLVAMIESHGDFNLLADVGTLAEGLAALEQYKPDILLADIGLPDGSSIDLIKAITLIVRRWLYQAFRMNTLCLMRWKMERRPIF